MARVASWRKGKEHDMEKKRAKKGKATKKVKDLPTKSLSAKHARGVKGGRKAGSKPVEYMKLTMKDTFITS